MLLRCSFAQVSGVARRRAEPHFDSVWASLNKVRRFRARVKSRRKIIRDALLAQVTQQLACERRLLRVWTPQNDPQELSGAPWEAPRGPLGRSWLTLEGLMGRSRALLSALGTLSGHSWSDAGAIIGALGNSYMI